MTADEEQSKLPPKTGPDHWVAYVLGRSPYAALSLSPHEELAPEHR
jgi:hypothetical protein